MKHKYLLLLLSALILSSCNSRNGKSNNTAADAAGETMMTGADADAHGCIGSAGYVWSELLQECIRPFETGIRLSPVADTGSGAVLAAYVVLSEDSLKAELFFPGETSASIYEKQINSGKNNIWKKQGDDLRFIQTDAGLWCIVENGSVTYKQDPTPEASY